MLTIALSKLASTSSVLLKPCKYTAQKTEPKLSSSKRILCRRNDAPSIRQRFKVVLTSLTYLTSREFEGCVRGKPHLEFKGIHEQNIRAHLLSEPAPEHNEEDYVDEVGLDSIAGAEQMLATLKHEAIQGWCAKKCNR